MLSISPAHLLDGLGGHNNTQRLNVLRVLGLLDLDELGLKFASLWSYVLFEREREERDREERQSQRKRERERERETVRRRESPNQPQ